MTKHMLAKCRLFYKKHPKHAIATKYLFLYLFFLSVILQTLDPDFGWHLISGKYILGHWVPNHDIFTYTAEDFRWINHEWLNDVLVAGLFKLGGLLPLSIFFAGLWTLAFFINGHRVRLVTLLIAACAVLPFIGIRPVTWTVVLFAVLLRICTEKSKRIKLLIPIIFLLWANLHGGFVLGVMVGIYFAFKNNDKYLWYLIAISLLVTLANPYGTSIYIEIGRTLTDPTLHSQIAEWQGFVFFKTAIPYLAFWVAGLSIFFRPRRYTSWLGLGPILLLASVLAVRNLPLFVVATYKELDEYITRFMDELPTNPVGIIKLAKVLVLAILIVITTAWLTLSNRTIYSLGFNGEKAYPRNAIQYLQRYECPGRIFADYDFGGYLIWKLSGNQVYIDGRMPSWRDNSGKKYIDKYLSVIKEKGTRNKEFTKYNIKCVLLKNTNTNKDLVDSLSEVKSWKVINTADNDSTLLIKQPD